MKKKIGLFVLMLIAVMAFSVEQSNAHPRYHRHGRVMTPHVRVIVPAPPVVVIRHSNHRARYVRPHYGHHRYYSYHRSGGNRRYCR